MPSLPELAESTYHTPDRGPFDGDVKQYAFSRPNDRNDQYPSDDAFKVDALTLARAIKMFRVGCAFPHNHSNGRIVHSKVKGSRSRDVDMCMSSEPGSYVTVWVNPSPRESWVKTARIHIEDPTIEMALLEAQHHGVEDVQASAGALTKATSRTGIRTLPRTTVAERSLGLQERMDQLELMKRELAMQVTELHKELERRMEEVWLIELYLGSKEEVRALRQGTPAGVDELIVVRQATLCMDEEIAVTDWLQNPDRIGEFDHTNIQDFDRWLVESDEHLNHICPWPKGIVALRPRRNMKPRNDWDAAARQAAERADSMTYLLIRNGQNLYRLWIDVRLWPRLVPRPDDLEAKSPHGGHIASWDRERAEKHRKQVGAGFLAITGLLQRSDLLNPLPRRDISAFNTSHVETYFRIIYDDDGHRLLGAGGELDRLTWKLYNDWLTEQLTVGVRVIVAAKYSTDDGIKERTGMHGPEWPSRGPHVLDSSETEGWFQYYNWSFLYRSTDTVWRDDGWRNTSGPRKKRVRFHCYTSELTPIDLLSWRLLEHMIRDRSQRAHYSGFFRLAFDLWRLAKDEAAIERPFVDLVLTQCGVDQGDDDERARCERLVRWWKLRTKHARTLDVDEAKALRMVSKAFRKGQDFDDDPEKRLLVAINRE